MSDFEFGPTIAKTKPALVVYIRPTSVQNWNQLGQKLSAIFANQQWKIESVPRGLSMTPGKLFSRNPDFGAPDMGLSIGGEGKTGSDTLGGFVSLKRRGETVTGMTTIHRVVDLPP